MTIETLVIWLVVGLIAGWLASAVVGGGYGIVGDIIIGVVGAFIGGWLFRGLGIGAPGSGIVSTIIVAFVGACVLLLLLRALHRTRYRST
ncbi:MAG TPA: GlsB/YeaQ/YmgE family stress response membrane protein [Archangium sp.]|nr:GlsB/YeaQ/YmgE family stress response membrane protein [Archangium sp.]